MTRKKEESQTRARLSPTATVAHLTDQLVDAMNIPALPDNVPSRLADAIRRRVQSLLFALKEARQQRYVGALEVRLVRDAFRAVLTAYELHLPEGEIFYAKFRELVEALGYERTEIGFRKSDLDDR